MSVRAFLRSPVALAWTFLGVIAVGGVVAAARRLAALAGRSTLLADPTAPVTPGGFLFAVAFVAATVAVAAVTWLPCSLAIAYAVGSRVRNEPASFGGSIELLRTRAEPLYRWVKTRIAIKPIADRILFEDDVSPAEIAVGCDAFVISALALDATTVRTAAGWANRAVPRAGRERFVLGGIGSTGLLVIGVFAAGTAAETGPFSPQTIALGAAVVGIVLTAAVDTAWRAGTYAGQNLEEGFT